MQRNSDPIFRREVSLTREADGLGRPRVALPRGAGVLSWLTVASVVALIMFMFLGTYTRRETVTGVLVPLNGVLQINAPFSGTIATIDVKEGMHVKAGESLFTLSGERASTAIGDTSAAVSEQLRSQRDKIDSAIAQSKSSDAIDALNLTHRIAFLKEKLRQLDAQITIQKRQKKNNDLILDRFRPLLEHGYVASIQVIQQESNGLELEVQMTSSLRQRLEALDQLSDLEKQREMLPIGTATHVSELQRKRLEIDGSLAENEAQRELKVTAPKDAIVSAILANQGQTASAGRPLLMLIEPDSPLRADLLVPSRAIGFAKVGTPISLRYLAFPYQKYGSPRGHVDSISMSALSAQQSSELLGKTVDEAMYKITVKLDSQTITADGATVPLRPGMGISADLLLDDRRIVDWVLGPLYSRSHGIAATPNAK